MSPQAGFLIPNVQTVVYCTGIFTLNYCREQKFKPSLLKKINIKNLYEKKNKRELVSKSCPYKRARAGMCLQWRLSNVRPHHPLASAPTSAQCWPCSSRVPLLPALPVHPHISLNPAQSKHIPSCSQHMDIPPWRGAGCGQARRKQSKSRAALLGAGITLTAPPGTGAASQSCQSVGCAPVSSQPRPGHDRA